MAGQDQRPRTISRPGLRGLLRGIAARGSSEGVTALVAGDRAVRREAAEALAAELGRDLFRIDLAEVASRYVGETEKALDRLIGEAAAGGSVLLIDEADALFARRSEVKDSHDRYANVDAESLLDRLESHPAPVIVAAARKSSLDPAFLRRLRHVFEFPPRR